MSNSVYPGGSINHLYDLADAYDVGDLSAHGMDTLKRLVTEYPDEARCIRAGREILRGSNAR